MFSTRLAWNSPVSALSERTAALAGRYLDLTGSNPTTAALDYPADALRRAFDRPEIAAYSPDPRGLPHARRALGPPDNLILTASTSESYSWLFKLLCNPGDEILVPRPSYPLFEFLAGLESVHVRTYPLRYAEGWFIDQPALAAALTPRTRAILLVHPNNPTGSFTSPAELDFLASLGLPLISDEVFAPYALTPPALPTLGGRPDVLTFVLDGLSKSAALPQMKAGWIRVTGPGAEAALDRLELIADTYLSISTPVQWALPALLEAGHGLRAQILTRLHANLARVPHALRCEGGWSAILRAPATRTDEEWTLHLLEDHGVLVQPGYFFDLDGGPYLIVSLLTPPAAFTEGLARIEAAFAPCP